MPLCHSIKFYKLDHVIPGINSHSFFPFFESLNSLHGEVVGYMLSFILLWSEAKPIAVVPSGRVGGH